MQLVQMTIYSQTSPKRPPYVSRKRRLSRQVHFAWNAMGDKTFHKLENGLTRQGGLSGGDRFRQVSQ